MHQEEYRLPKKYRTVLRTENLDVGSIQKTKRREEIAIPSPNQPARGNPISALVHNMFRMVNVQLLFIVMDDTGIDMLFENIDICAGEFAGADAALEE